MGYTLAWNNGSCHLKTAVLLLLLQFFFCFFYGAFWLAIGHKNLNTIVWNHINTNCSLLYNDFNRSQLFVETYNIKNTSTFWSIYDSSFFLIFFFITPVHILILYCLYIHLLYMAILICVCVCESEWKKKII